MGLLLKFKGTNLRAHLYQHALSRAGLDTTPMRETLDIFHNFAEQAIKIDWLSLRNWSAVEN